MSMFKLLVSEIRFRRFNFLLGVLAVVTAATLFVAGPTLISGYAADTNDRIERQEQDSATKLAQMRKETNAELTQLQQETDALLAGMDKQTKRLMRELGFNLRIVHQDTNMGDLYANFMAKDMPEEYVHRLANAEQITKIVHLVATLQQKVKWQDRTVLLVGVLPEVTQSHIEKKPPMGYNIKPGTVYVGYELAGDRKIGDEVEIEGKTFEIAQILPEQGSREDVMLALHLHDAQQVLDRPGKVNQIMALGCKCEGERLPQIRAELEGVLPETKITEHRTRAIARAEQRELVAGKRAQLIAQQKAAHQRAYKKAEAGELAILKDLKSTRSGVQNTMDTLVYVTTPLVVLASAVFVGLMTWTNVRERRPEIGTLRALGKGGGSIAALFLGKAALVGLFGGLLGCVIGQLLAQSIGGTLHVAGEVFQPDVTLLACTLVGAPIVAAFAAYLPTLSAIIQEPTVVLMDH